MPTYDLTQDYSGYGIYDITAQSSADGYEDSDVAHLTYNVGATISIKGDTLTVTDVISGVTAYKIYVDDVLVGTENAPSSGAIAFDLSSYSGSLADGKHSVTVCAVGTGIAENRSNAVTWFVGTAPIYGVSGLYSSSTALTRTDDAVDYDYVINSSSGSIDSDFNELFPWTEAEVVALEQGKFLHLPEMYFRIGKDNEGRLTDIAVSAQPSSTGDWFKVDEFYYGCYGAAQQSQKLVSRSGVDRLTSSPRSTFRTYAAAAGSGYCQLDLYHRTVLMFLWYIEFATKKSDSVMTGRINGSGTSGGSTRRPTGGTDSVETPSGFETAYAQMRYHYIEDFIGNTWEFVDGVYCSTTRTADYVTDSPSSFSDDTTGKTQLSYTSPASGCLAALGWDDDHPFLCMPHSTISDGGYSTYFCDQAYNSTSVRPVLYCGSNCNNANAGNGLSYFGRLSVSVSFDGLGGRLLKVS